ncbi:hypothetical protein RN629_10590 [Sphingomonadaceae bacterium jetA1]|jgi:hypothetical protein
MVDTPDPKTPRPPRRRASPKTAGSSAFRKRPPAKASDDTLKTGGEEGASAETSAKPKVKSPPKPRSTKRASPRKSPPRRPTPIKAAPAPVLGKQGLDRIGGKWGVASLLGSLAACAAVAAALLSLRGSTPNAGEKGTARD